MPCSLTSSRIWNTGAPITGQTIPDHLLPSLSPLAWAHVNLTGDYLWEENLTLDENGIRAIPFSPWSVDHISVPL
ncbi:hypothetical protein [Brucella sp. LJL56]